MAEKAHARGAAGHMMHVFTWESVGDADTFQAVEVERLPYIYSIQGGGTFGGGAIALHGSLDGVSYFPLADRSGSAISLTAAGLSDAVAFVRFLKPVASGGSGRSLSVTLLVGYQP